MSFFYRLQTLVVALFVLLVSPAINAQTNPDAPTQAETPDAPVAEAVDEEEIPTRDSEPTLESTPKEELKNQGWIFGDTTSLASSSTATLIALSAGFLVHGAGHFYSGETRVALSLLAIELAGLSLMLGSGIYGVADGGAGTGNGIAAPLFQLGWSMFLSSYFLDIVGSIQGTDFEFERNTQQLEGISLDLGYGFISANGTPARHILVAGIEFDLDFITVEALTHQDVLLVTSEYQAEVGFRLLRVRPQTFLLVKGVGNAFNVDDDAAFWRTGAEGRFGGSLDLGHFFRKFDQVAVGTWFGFGNYWYNFGPTLDFANPDFTQTFVSHESFLHLNLTENVNLRFAHGSHPGWYVASPTRYFGVTKVGLSYKTDFGSFGVNTELGDGVAIWLGGRLTL